MKNRKFKILFLFPILMPLMLVGANLALAQEMAEEREQDQNCTMLYNWFRIPQEKGDDNAVKNLPQFCSVQQVIIWVIDRLLLLAGSVAVIFLIIGGFRYLTSAGNEEAAEKGKKTLVTSIIGLAIILLSGAIVRVVASTLNTGNASPKTESTSGQPAESEETVTPDLPDELITTPPPTPPSPPSPSPRGGE